MKNTSIQWAIDTANPTSGCAGCELARPSLKPDDTTCYAYHVHMNRLRHSQPEKYAQSFFDVRLIPGRIAQYARGRDLRGVEKKDHPWLPRAYPRLIFISDMGDALSPAVPFEYLRDEIIEQAGLSADGRRHVWLWLTKQPKQLIAFYDWLAEQKVAWPTNIWPGVSVTGQNVLWRVDALLSRPFARTFVSYEPAWEWVDFFSNRTRFPSMIIAGGASGAKARPFDIRWAESIIQQCRAHDVAPFIKQLGAHAIGGNGTTRFKTRDSHGGDWDEWPEHIRVRDLPSLP